MYHRYMAVINDGFQHSCMNLDTWVRFFKNKAPELQTKVVKVRVNEKVEKFCFYYCVAQLWGLCYLLSPFSPFLPNIALIPVFCLTDFAARILPQFLYGRVPERIGALKIFDSVQFKPQPPGWQGNALSIVLCPSSCCHHQYLHLSTYLVPNVGGTKLPWLKF